MTRPLPPAAADQPEASPRVSLFQHIVNVSAGKDSTALYLLALQRGRPFRPVMADTSHEHPLTVEYAHLLPERTGGPAVETVRADFSAEIAARRVYVETAWRAEGVPEATIERALAVLHPTGNPFVDLTLWKGRFPSRRAQFCTEYLKERAVWDAVVGPALVAGPVVQWLGVRRDESARRQDAPFTQRVRYDDRHDMLLFRPLIHWSARNTFAFAKAHGVPPNPLYLMGAGRVGCWPCINAGKDELMAIRRVDPMAVERLLEWEALVKAAAKRGAATFFAADVTPEGAALAKRLKRQAAAWVAREHPDAEPARVKVLTKAKMSELSAGAPWPRADEVFAWAETLRGGRQLGFDNWLADQDPDEGLSCSSQYGLCE